MNLITNISSFLIGASFSLLLFNPIAFGVSLILGTLILLIYHRKDLVISIKPDKRVLFSIIFLVCSFLISSSLSIVPERSFPVIFYLFCFIVLSFLLFNCLKQNTIIYNKLIKFFIISSYLNIIFISIYVSTDISCKLCQDNNNFNVLYILKHMSVSERYKGFLNIFALNTIILNFFYKSKFNLIILLILIPCLVISNCNSAILGILIGIFSVILFFIFNIFFKKKYFLLFSFFLCITVFSQLVKNLPSDFSQQKNENFEPIIPVEVVDIHRQFMWGFTISKFLEKPIFGFGPDTSNFIPEGQKEIGSKHTGKMYFISSHPHNFLAELFLEVGIFGTLLFIIFIINLNIFIAKECSRKQLYYLLFYNSYFWGASLVNFSFWQGWWQASYYVILSLMSAKIFFEKNKTIKKIKL